MKTRRAIGSQAARNVLGIEIGGTKLQIVLGSRTGQIRERHRFNVNPLRGGIGIRRAIASALPALLKTGQPKAIGVGFGGPVDWRTGKICCSHQIKGWSKFELGPWLRELSGLPVAVDNDANVAALGEACCGAGQAANPVFYVTLGSGVGGGLVVDQAIYHGDTPGESEIGHIRLDRTGTIVEDRCSGWAVDRRIRALKAAGATGELVRLSAADTQGEARHLAAALAAQDPEARRILTETAQDLAFALSHVTHLFHPQVIVLGGGLSLLGEPLRAAVARHLPDFVMSAFSGGPEVRLAGLEEDSVPVGALRLAAKAR
jgi:glucokinase